MKKKRKTCKTRPTRTSSLKSLRFSPSKRQKFCRWIFHSGRQEGLLRSTEQDQMCDLNKKLNAQESRFSPIESVSKINIYVANLKGNRVASYHDEASIHYRKCAGIGQYLRYVSDSLIERNNVRLNEDILTLK